MMLLMIMEPLKNTGESNVPVVDFYKKINDATF